MNKKSEFKLKYCVENLVKRFDRSQLFFMTLTFPRGKHTENEVRKRVHSFQTNILGRQEILYIRVVETHRDGRTHYHYVLVLPWVPRGEVIAPEVINTKANQYNIERRHYTGRVKELSADIRHKVKKYGIGRSNFTPVKNLEALAKYLTKEVVGSLGKNNRRWSCSKELRLIKGSFSWVGKRPAAYRKAMQFVCLAYGCYESSEMKATFGPGWFLRVRNLITDMAAEIADGVINLQNVALMSALQREPVIRALE